MTRSDLKTQRCAIYTRKSTEHGLELEFNSLDAQREACEAYIKSQASLGWKIIPTQYNDAAFSGGNLERPALKQLMADIEAGKVDTIVVYKIDRLTRSLADFAKLVETFDAKSISFVAVTQQFNTTSSMGRLTLNVLLSFAQFERELGSERVRDKIAASRAKGKWTGGNVPIGYNVKDKKLVPNPIERKTVATIFELYAELGSFQKLVDELAQRKIVSKARKTVKQPRVGSIPFTYGPLAYLLKNRIYVGEARHKTKWFAGEHEPIINRELFERVQLRLENNAVERKQKRTDSNAPLLGKLFDDRGNKMSPSHTNKNGIRYRSYVSTALLKGCKQDAGSVKRLSATRIESLVASELHDRLNIDQSVNDQEILCNYVARAEITQDAISLTTLPVDGKPAVQFTIAWDPKPTNSTSIIEAANGGEPNPKLVNALTRAHAYLQDVLTGRHTTIESLAQATQTHPKKLRQELQLAFLAPDIVEGILNGDRGCGLTVTKLLPSLPLSWAEQREKFAKL